MEKWVEKRSANEIKPKDFQPRLLSAIMCRLMTLTNQIENCLKCQNWSPYKI